MQMASTQFPFDQGPISSVAVYSRLVREHANIRSILCASPPSHITSLSLSLVPSSSSSSTSASLTPNDITGYQQPSPEKNLPVQLLECAYAPPVMRIH